MSPRQIIATVLAIAALGFAQVSRSDQNIYWCAHIFEGISQANPCTTGNLKAANGPGGDWVLAKQSAIELGKERYDNHFGGLVSFCSFTTGHVWPEDDVNNTSFLIRNQKHGSQAFRRQGTSGPCRVPPSSGISGVYWYKGCRAADPGTCIEPEKNLACHVDGEGNCPTNNGTNPIHAFTGNKYQQETDFIASGDHPLRFERHYNSQAGDQESRGRPTTGSLSSPGVNWRHTYERAIVPSAGGARVAYRHTGRALRFESQGSLWVPDADVPLTLRQETNSLGEIEFVLTDRDNGAERYGFDGRLLSITPRGGMTQTVEYDADGRITAVHDGFGDSITFTYNAEGRVATVTDPSGDVYIYTYDSIGNLIEVTAPDGYSRSYEYADSRHPHALTALIDESGRVVGRWEYDAAGRGVASEGAGGTNRVTLDYEHVQFQVRTHVTEANGATRTYRQTVLHKSYKTTSVSGDPCTGCGTQAAGLTYDGNGFVKTSTDRNGVVTRFVRDDRGRELERIEAFGTPEQRTITTQWNASLGVPTRVTEPGRETTFTYDSAGRRLSETIRDLATGGTRTTHWTYNAAGQVLTMTGPRGEVTTNTYDNLGNLRTTTNALGHVTSFDDYDGHGNAGTITDPNGVVTTLVYDARQRLLSRTTAGETTAFQYDGAGRLLRLTLPNGAFVDYEYDAAGRLVAIEDNLGNRIDYELDLMGNRTAEYVSGPDSVTVRESFSTYDKLNRLVGTLGGEGQTTAFEYDARGNPVSTTDAFGNATTTRYDTLNRVFEQVDALSGVTQYAYNPLDQLTQVVDPRGVTTGYTYNAFGDVLSVASPDAGTTTYAYDTAGNRIRQTDARGVVTEYDYDLLNRLVSIRYPATLDKDIAYTWDTGAFGIGRLSRIDDGTGSTEYQYDALGRVTARVGTVRGTTLVHFMEYDAAGNLTALMHPDGGEVVYARDAAGRVSGIEWVAPGAGPVALVTGVTWQQFGGIEGFIYGNGIAHSRTYDLSGRVTGIASGAVQQLAYQWDATDNITAITDLVDSTNSQSFGYDGLYRLTAASGAYGILGYGYDALGNRTALTVDGTVTTYTYAPDSNHLTTVDDGTGPVNFEYDAAGNTLTDGSRTFSYDARNRMTAADGHAYGYNALGQRAFKPRFQTAAPGDADGDGVIDQNDLLALRDMIKGKIPASPGADCNGDGAVDNQDTNCIARQIGATKSQGKGKNSDTETETVTTAATDGEFTQAGWVLFAYDEAGHLIGEYDEAGTPIRQYVWLEDLPVAVISTEGIHYLHADHLNTPKVVTDSSGTIVWQADYQPFGEVTEVVANTEMNLRFPGQYHDRETNLYQNWHREYMPELGRYSQSDPIGLEGGINLYTYAGSSPLAFQDPIGLVRWKGTASTIGVIYGGGGVRFSFELTSECIKGLRGQATVIAGGPSVGFGIKFTGASSSIEFEDNRHTPDPYVFLGRAKFTGAGVALGPENPRPGVGRPTGIGFSVSAVQLGGARAIGASIQYGLDFSVFGGAGTAFVQEASIESCECSP